jgi:hypothetical protein
LGAVQSALGVGESRYKICMCLAGEEELGRFSAEKIEYYRLYLHSGKLTLAVAYLR